MDKKPFSKQKRPYAEIALNVMLWSGCVIKLILHCLSKTLNACHLEALFAPRPCHPETRSLRALRDLPLEGDPSKHAKSAFRDDRGAVVINFLAMKGTFHQKNT